MSKSQLSLVFAIFLVGGCTASRPPTPLPVRTGRERGVVYVADGAGGFEATSNSLRQVIESEKLPLWVEMVDWSHGYGRVFADQIDLTHARHQGRKLAEDILAQKRCCPNLEIYLVAHSAGSAVVLAAAEQLPPSSVDRIILLAPAVSADYDLRPALRTVCRSIEVFHSDRDYIYLGAGTAIVGTADRRWAAAAGRVGFRPRIDCPGDTELYCRLRQHPWNRSLEWTGNRGGHYGTHEQEYQRAYVVPLLSR